MIQHPTKLYFKLFLVFCGIGLAMLPSANWVMSSVNNYN